MNDIKALEVAVGDAPLATATRLAWAAALDDAGQPFRAAYQRLIAEFHARPSRSPRDTDSIGRFMALADDLGYKELSRYMFQAAAYEALFAENVHSSTVDTRRHVSSPGGSARNHSRSVLEQIWTEAGKYVSQAASQLVHPFTAPRMDRPLTRNDVWLIPVIASHPITISTQRGLPYEVACTWWSWMKLGRELFTHLPIDAVRLPGRPSVRFSRNKTFNSGTLYLDLPNAHWNPQGIVCSYAKYRSFGSDDRVPTRFVVELLRKQWPMVREWYFPRASPPPVEDEE